MHGGTTRWFNDIDLILLKVLNSQSKEVNVHKNLKSMYVAFNSFFMIILNFNDCFLHCSYPRFWRPNGREMIKFQSAWAIIYSRWFYFHYWRIFYIWLMPTRCRFRSVSMKRIGSRSGLLKNQPETIEKIRDEDPTFFPRIRIRLSWEKKIRIRPEIEMKKKIYSWFR